MKAVITVLVWALISLPVSAETVAFSFTGTVTGQQSDVQIVSPGDVISGQFTINLNSPIVDEDLGGVVQRVFYDDAILSLALAINGVSATSAVPPLNGAEGSSVSLNTNTGTSAFSHLEQLESNAVDGWAIESMRISGTDFDGLFSDLALPTSFDGVDAAGGVIDFYRVNNPATPVSVSYLIDSFTTLSADDDGDNVVDEFDNCLGVANPDQRDTNGDGFGNLCDPDLNNDGVVNFSDIALWQESFFTVNNGDPDFNDDGFVNFSDFTLFSSFFLSAPGPSGLAQ